MSEFDEVFKTVTQELKAIEVEDKTLSMLIDRDLNEIKQAYLKQDHVLLAVIATRHLLVLHKIIR